MRRAGTVENVVAEAVEVSDHVHDRSGRLCRSSRWDLVVLFIKPILVFLPHAHGLNVCVHHIRDLQIAVVDSLCDVW